MERKGAFIKGRSSRVHSVNTYRLFQQKYKQWRAPAFGALALLLFFGLVPGVGDQLQTSLLTASSTQEMVQNHPELARKTLIGYAAGIVKECEQFKLDDCAAEGKKVLADISNERVNAPTVFEAVSIYDGNTVAARARASCLYEAPKYLNALNDARSKLSGFADSYAENLSAPNMADELAQIDASYERIRQMVVSCEAK